MDSSKMKKTWEFRTARRMKTIDVFKSGGNFFKKAGKKRLDLAAFASGNGLI